MHDVRTPEEIKTTLGPGGAMEAFQAAKKAGKCRFIGFTGHFDPATHATMLKAYDRWDSVLMPVHAGRKSRREQDGLGCCQVASEQDA